MRTTDGQAAALTGAGCTRVWTETASGALDRRPKLDQVLDHLRPGDTLVVVRLDRLGRSLRHLIDVVTGLADRGVHFRSLSEGFDTSTAGGRMIFQVLGSLAEFERAIIRERTLAGLEVARARGRKGGRKPKMTDAKRATARKLYDDQQPCPSCTLVHRGHSFGPPKTTSGEARRVDLDAGTAVGVLLAHRLAQDSERAEWGSAYIDHGLVFARQDGNPLPLDVISKRFRELAAGAGLRPIRLHDLSARRGVADARCRRRHRARVETPRTQLDRPDERHVLASARKASAERPRNELLRGSPATAVTNL